MLKTRVFRVLKSFNFRLCHAFAKLSPQAQKAVWSCRIIKEISEAKQEAGYFEVIDGKKTLKPSLADTIKNLKISQMGCRKGELDEDIRQEVVNMFIKGAALNYNLFQQRILDGAYTNQQYSNLPFVFHPNALVTKLMFNVISFEQMPNYDRLLLFGNQGTSKTVAMVLYHHLSSLVNHYFYKAHSDSKQMEELNSLLKRNLIKKVPKIFYYSPTASFGQYQFLRHIKKQCTEIISIKQDYQKLQKIQLDSLMNIQQLYQNRGIQTVAIFDQFEMVASVLRIYNTELKENKLQQSQYNISKYNLKSAKQQIQRIKYLQQLCRHIFLTSSANIEIQLLRKQPYPSPNCQYTLDLNRHSDIRYKKLPYDKFLFQPWGQVSFSHCVWFQIQRKLVSLSIPSQSIQRMKVIYFQKLESTNHRWPNYMTFLNVRKAVFPSNNNLIRFLEDIKESNYYRKLDEKIHQIISKDFRTHIQTLALFMQKGTIIDKQRRLKIVTSLFQFISEISEDSHQNLQPLRIPLKDFQTKLGFPVSFFLQEQRKGVELFPLFIEGGEEQVAVFFYTPAELKRIYSHFILIFIKSNLSTLQFYQQQFIQNPNALGKFVQFALLFMLMKQFSLISIQIQQLRQTLSMHIRVFRVRQFLHFNNQKDAKIWNNFQPLLQTALLLADSNRSVIGVPVTISEKVEGSSDFGIMSLSYNSKCFVAARVECVEDFYHIDTFGFTTETSIEKLKEKVREAAELLQQITNDDDIDPFQSTGIVLPSNKADTKKDHAADNDATFKQDQLIRQKYPTFNQVKQNKNFKVRHIIFLPKQGLEKVLAYQRKDKQFSVQKTRKLVNQNQQKKANKNEQQIKEALKYNGKYWQICFAGLEDIMTQGYNVKQQQLLFKAALNLLHLKKGPP